MMTTVGNPLAGGGDESGGASQTSSRHSKRVAVACDYCRKKRVRMRYGCLYRGLTLIITTVEVHR